MSEPKVYLITGANRGLGRGLLEALAQRPNTTVIAAVRNTTDASANSLGSVPTASGSKIITVTIDSSVDTSAKEAIEVLQTQHGITRLDTVIANAGISKYYGPAVETPAKELRDHFEVNVIGSLLLFQATAALLKRSVNPVFVALSTGVASIGDMGNIPVAATAYGISKAGLNYMVRKIHFENPDIIAFALSPGWVQTDMGNLGATSSGMEKAPVTIEDSVSGMLTKIDHATKDHTSGTFQSFDETQFAW